jgi:hypothetical protein
MRRPWFSVSFGIRSSLFVGCARAAAPEDVESQFDQTVTAYGLNYNWCAQLGAPFSRDSSSAALQCAN